MMYSVGHLKKKVRGVFLSISCKFAFQDLCFEGDFAHLQLQKQI